ncbi:protein of unknown function [Paraburkholderia dioscoreae]|uniref:Uncharacterized protein n=1 Tax=Paraburkholderia dioscoreae TaxID=2604047 RepID=A0A5Q4ZJ94_9BURK|nr:protein of unknown function [Paraburkholderia dioscoreae]
MGVSGQPPGTGRLGKTLLPRIAKCPVGSAGIAAEGGRSTPLGWWHWESVVLLSSLEALGGIVVQSAILGLRRMMVVARILVSWYGRRGSEYPGNVVAPSCGKVVRTRFADAGTRHAFQSLPGEPVALRVCGVKAGDR